MEIRWGRSLWRGWIILVRERRWHIISPCRGASPIQEPLNIVQKAESIPNLHVARDPRQGKARNWWEMQKNKYKMQECTPGNATCCAESWINPQSTCCSTSAGAEHKRSKKGGRWEMQMRGQKANVSRCRIDVLNFRLLESAFDLFLANVWFYYQLAEHLCQQYQLCHFTEIKDFFNYRK